MEVQESSEGPPEGDSPSAPSPTPPVSTNATNLLANLLPNNKLNPKFVNDIIEKIKLCLKTNKTQKNPLLIPDNSNDSSKSPQIKPPKTQISIPKPPPRPKTPPVHPKKPKRSTSINSFVYESRPRAPVSPSTRPVLTPSWNNEKPLILTTENISDTSEIALSNYDFIKAHSRLEIFEGRIQAGQETRVGHPAEAHIIADSSPDTIFTPDEISRANNYQNDPDDLGTPLFWPKRAWDTKIMTEEETAQLKIKIEEAESRHTKETEREEPSGTVVDNSTKNKRRRRRNGMPLGRTKRGASVIALPLDDFVTDCDDDVITDWEDL